MRKNGVPQEEPSRVFPLETRLAECSELCSEHDLLLRQQVSSSASLETPKNGVASSDRLERILKVAKHQVHTRGLGTSFKPRRSTQDCVDLASNEIAMVILSEPDQVAGRVLELYTAYVSVRTDGNRCRREDISRGMAYEWDAQKIINDRIMNWYRYEALKGDPHRLCYGQVIVEVYHRCQEACIGNQTNLLQIHKARVFPDQRSRASLGTRLAAPSASLDAVTDTKHTLHGCCAGGMIHLCRRNTANCLSLSQSAETSVVCMASGNVLWEEGLAQVWSQGKPGGGYGQNRPGLLDAMSAEISHEVKAALPENQRRAKAIGTMLKTGCPQIVNWDVDTGELILDFTRAFPEMNRFDPTFLWELPPTTHGLSSSIFESLPGRTLSIPASLGTSVGCTSSPEPEEEKPVAVPFVTTMKSLPLKRRRKRRIVRGSAGTSAATSITNKDRQTVVRVLKDVLWDPDTRYLLNQRAAPEVSSSASAAILAELNSPAYVSHPATTTTTTTTNHGSKKKTSLVCGLLAHLAQRHQSQSPHQDHHDDDDDDKQIPRTRFVPILSHMGRVVHRACRETLIPIVLPRPSLEAQLVQCILYLWNFVMHIPEVSATAAAAAVGTGASEIRLPKQKRNPHGKNATLTQFALGFLYTAAGIGIELNKEVGWPRDWWLWNNLPSADSIHHYGKPQRKRHISKTGWGRLDVLANLSKLTPASLTIINNNNNNNNTKAMNAEVALVYQMKDITRGKRALGEAVSEYTGKIPKASEVAAYLRQAYKKIHQVSTSPSSSSEKFTALRKSGLKRHRNDDDDDDGDTLTLAQKAMNRIRERNAKSLRFCCMYLSGTRHHLCVTFNPWDSTGAPGLSPQVMRKGQWSLGLIVGPFVKEADARRFCIEWGRPRYDNHQRQDQGIKLAGHVGLQTWGSQATPIILTPAMEAAAESQKRNNLTARRRLRAARTQRLVEVMMQGNSLATECLIPVRQTDSSIPLSASPSWVQQSRSMMVPQAVVNSNRSNSVPMQVAFQIPPPQRHLISSLGGSGGSGGGE